MRCPKCGYISFDFVDECLKCKKNIKSASDVLMGAVPKVPAPSFLKFRPEPETNAKQAGSLDEISPVDSSYDEGGSDFLTHDADFPDEEVGGIELMGDSFEDSDDTQEMSVSSFDDDDVQDGEIEVDLSQFEEISDPEAAFLSEPEDAAEADEEMFEISVPDELSDMSDLDPPAMKTEAEDLGELDLNLDEGSQDFDLDDLNFDLALDDIDIDESPASRSVEDTVLSLEDIDFSEALSGELETEDVEPASHDMDMDGDLDFELDLGGLSIHKDV